MVYVRGGIIDVAKSANFNNNSVREMELDSLNGRADGRYSGIGFVEISKIFVV